MVFSLVVFLNNIFIKKSSVFIGFQLHKINNLKRLRKFDMPNFYN